MLTAIVLVIEHDHLRCFFETYELQTVVAAQVIVTQLNAPAEPPHSLAQQLELFRTFGLVGREEQDLSQARVDVPRIGRDKQHLFQAENRLLEQALCEVDVRQLGPTFSIYRRGVQERSKSHDRLARPAHRPQQGRPPLLNRKQRGILLEDLLIPLKNGLQLCIILRRRLLVQALQGHDALVLLAKAVRELFQAQVGALVVAGLQACCEDVVVNLPFFLRFVGGEEREGSGEGEGALRGEEAGCCLGQLERG